MAISVAIGAGEYVRPAAATSIVSSSLVGSLASDASDTIFGSGRGDFIIAGAGNDFIYTGAGDDTAYGGPGDDFFDDYAASVHGEREIFHGGPGDDTMHGWTGDDSLYGGSGSDLLHGEGDDDRLDGGAGADAMYGGSGDDVYYVDVAADRIFESDRDVDWKGDEGGVDTVYATSSFTLSANVENLALVGATAANGTGNGANNNLYGNSLANTLRGLGGADTFRSGGGADSLIGGAGNDLFQYLTVVGSTPASRDVLRAGDGATAFQGAGSALGDRFDFALIDANATLAGVQDFAFGTATGKGRLWAATSGSNTLIRGNTDNDAAAELEIVVQDGTVLASAYSAADFLL